LIGKALAQPQLVTAYANAGLTVRFMGAAEFGRFWDDQIARFALAIKASGAVKEAARLLLRDQPLTGVDLVLIGRDGTAKRDFAALQADLSRAMRRAGVT